MTEVRDFFARTSVVEVLRGAQAAPPEGIERILATHFSSVTLAEACRRCAPHDAAGHNLAAGDEVREKQERIVRSWLTTKSTRVPRWRT